MGDFNSEPFEERIIDLNKTMKDAYFVSKEKPFGPEGTFNAFRHQEPVQKRIDYIFVSNHETIEVLKHDILSDSKDLKYPSDHLPVIIEAGF
jgi:endonuclease/exonuclease/phosphatase family metal-dependent hydrolase